MLTAIPLKHGMVAAGKVLRESGTLLQRGGGRPSTFDAPFREPQRKVEWSGGVPAGLMMVGQGLEKAWGGLRVCGWDHGATHRNFRRKGAWWDLEGAGEVEVSRR